MPIGSLGRTREQNAARCLTAGASGGHVEFGTVAPRTGWNPRDGQSDAPSPQFYRANYATQFTRATTLDMQRSSSTSRSLKNKTGGSHLELTSPDHSPIKPKSFIPMMNKGDRDTSLSRPTAGSHTAYEPKSMKPNTTNCPVRIGDMASRSQRTGTRFENAYALPGDFMPKHEEMDP